MTSEDFKVHFSKTTQVLIQIGAVMAAISAIAGGYVFYLNYVWKPTVLVTDVDFNNATATLKMGNKTIQLEGDALFLLGGDWGVRFGSTSINGTQVYDRLELVRKGMVYEYLKK